MRYVIADARAYVRKALIGLLEAELDFELVGELNTATDLVDQCRICSPELLLLDWELPGNGAQEWLGVVREICPGIRIVALSSRPEAQEPSLAAGVDAFVSKGDPPDCVLVAIRDVIARGDTTPQ